MKLSKQALAVLKNFSTINEGIVIKKGNNVRTMSVAKDILADATLDVEFPCDFAIYDLNEFLQTISMFDDPDLDFNDSFINITEGGARVRYYYSDASIVISPPENPNLPEGTIDFEMKNDDLKKLQRSASIMKIEDLAITGSSDGIEMTVADSSNSTSNRYSMTLEGDTDDFEVALNMGNLRLLPSNYDVNITLGAFARFTGKEEAVKYWIALDN